VFQCAGELAKLETNSAVKSIGLGYTDCLTSLDGMRQMSQMSLLEDKDSKPSPCSKKSAKSEVK
jgi:hypothetical protein